MAKITVHAGDFIKGEQSRFDYTLGQGTFHLLTPDHRIMGETISVTQVESVEVATEDAVKRIGGTVGWGIAGATLLGPAGLLAGLLLGGKSKEVTFICQFRDGRKFLGTIDAKGYRDIQSALMNAPKQAQLETAIKERSEKKAKKKSAQKAELQAKKANGNYIQGTHVALVVFIIGMGWMFYSISTNPNVSVGASEDTYTPKVKSEPVFFDGPGLLLQNKDVFDSKFGAPKDVQQSGEIQQVIYHKDGIEYLINFNKAGQAFDTHINRIDGQPLTIFEDKPRNLPKLAGYKDRSPDHVGELGARFNNVGNAGEIRFNIFKNEVRDIMVDAPAP